MNPPSQFRQLLRNIIRRFQNGPLLFAFSFFVILSLLVFIIDHQSIEMKMSNKLNDHKKHITSCLPFNTYGFIRGYYASFIDSLVEHLLDTREPLPTSIPFKDSYLNFDNLIAGYVLVKYDFTDNEIVVHFGDTNHCKPFYLEDFDTIRPYRIITTEPDTNAILEEVLKYIRDTTLYHY